MIITADLSLYPLRDGHVPPIIEFIHDLGSRDGLTIKTNQLSTQITGDFDAVTAAINACMRRAMEKDGAVVLVAKYLNMAKDIGRAPDLQ